MAVDAGFGDGFVACVKCGGPLDASLEVCPSCGTRQFPAADAGSDQAAECDWCGARNWNGAPSCRLCGHQELNSVGDAAPFVPIAPRFAQMVVTTTGVPEGYEVVGALFALGASDADDGSKLASAVAGAIGVRLHVGGNLSSAVASAVHSLLRQASGCGADGIAGLRVSYAKAIGSGFGTGPSSQVLEAFAYGTAIRRR